jgi:hypothetical protein
MKRLLIIFMLIGVDDLEEDDDNIPLIHLARNEVRPPNRFF